MFFGIIFAVFVIGILGLVFGLVFGALGLVFRLGFFALQVAGALIGFLLFGGGLFAVVAVLVVLNLIGLPILCLRGRK